MQKEIFKAAKTGDTAKIGELLQADPSLVNAVDGELSTPLHYAAWKDHREAAMLLLEMGADVNAVNQNTHWGSTPLHAAAHGNNAAIVRLLIAHGAVVDAKDSFGKTPLDHTAFHSATAAAKALRESDARPC